MYNRYIAYTRIRKWYAKWTQRHKKLDKQLITSGGFAHFLTHQKWGTSTSRSCFCCEASKNTNGTHRLMLPHLQTGVKRKGWECNGVGKNWQRPWKKWKNSHPPSPEPKQREQVRTLPNEQQTQCERCWHCWNKFKSSIPFLFWFFQRDEKSHKEVFMLICLLSKQIFSNLLKIRRSSFSKSACLFLRSENRMNKKQYQKT